MATHNKQCRFESAHGRVDFYMSNLPGLCGGAVVHDVNFAVTNDNKNKFYKDFDHYLKNHRSGDYEWRVGKLIASDVVKPTGKNASPSVYDFCCEMEWWVGEPVRNPKTGYRIVICETDREYLSNHGRG